MDAHHNPPRGLRSFAALWTTTLACLWGAAAAYILFDSLLISHNNRFALAAIVPLVAVWATLERKRWGRLALAGLSLTTVGVFASLLLVFAVQGSQRQAEAQTIEKLMAAYGISTTVAAGLLTLAVITGAWLCHPLVSAEFNKNKRATLVIAQRGIATILVGCWGAAIALTPLFPDNKHDAMNSSHVRSAPRQTYPLTLHNHVAQNYANHATNNRLTRSAASAKSR